MDSLTRFYTRGFFSLNGTPDIDFQDYILGEVDFWIFWIFNFLQFAIDGKNNSKTKVEKVFFFIFMSSYAEMSFLKQKITK
jgi:hypothetical protein